MQNLLNVLTKVQPVERPDDPTKKAVEKARHRNRCALANFRDAVYDLIGDHRHYEQFDTRRAPHK